MITCVLRKKVSMLSQFLKFLYEQVDFKNFSRYSGRNTFTNKLANSGADVRVIVELDP